MTATQFTNEAYNHDGVALRLSGYRDEDECVIERVTAADSQIDLVDLFEVPKLLLMAERLDAQLSREASAHNAEMRAEMHRYDREFAIA